MNETAPVKAPPQVLPGIKQDPVRRYSPDPNHCPTQTVRTVRRIRRTIGE